MRIVETGAKQCGCGSTRVVITPFLLGSAELSHSQVDCDVCGAELAVGPIEKIAFRYSGVEQEAPSLDCPNCKRPRRERGEVRTHVWKCGCPVRPEKVGYDMSIDESRRERVWYAEGPGYREHPTREGAIAAWREKLADEQRREDERAASVRVAFAKVIQGALTDDQVDAAAVAMSRSLVGIDYATGPDRTAIGVALEDSKPGPDGSLVTVQVYPGGMLTRREADAACAESEARAGRPRVTTATMPAAQSAELVRVTVPPVDFDLIDRAQLPELCELATDLAKQRPERMDAWRVDQSIAMAWRVDQSIAMVEVIGWSFVAAATLARIEYLTANGQWRRWGHATGSEMRGLVRFLAGEVA